MKKLSLTTKFLLNSFCTAVLINTIVISAHILTAKDYSYSESLNVIFCSLAISVALFAVVCIALALISMVLKHAGKEKRFWILMIIGIVASTVIAKFVHFFEYFKGQPVTIASISAFSILVSLTAQYELLTDEDFKGSFHIEPD